MSERHSREPKSLGPINQAETATRNQLPDQRTTPSRGVRCGPALPGAGPDAGNLTGWLTAPRQAAAYFGDRCYSKGGKVVAEPAGG
jgi:hypothetical protein